MLACLDSNAHIKNCHFRNYNTPAYSLDDDSVASMSFTLEGSDLGVVESVARAIEQEECVGSVTHTHADRQ